MALVKGTNCGFVTVAPLVNPLGTNVFVDNSAVALKDTSPAGAVKITEIGWYCDNATEETNFEVGIYDHNAALNKPGNLLAGASQTNAKGTTVGWKKATVNITITENTIYWIGMQLDDTATATAGNYGAAAGEQYNINTPQSTLPDPWGSSDYPQGNLLFAVYAVWEAAVGTNMKINIGDAWKDVVSLKKNIGGVWKDVVKTQQNIGDVWKNVFG